MFSLPTDTIVAALRESGAICWPLKCREIVRFACVFFNVLSGLPRIGGDRNLPIWQPECRGGENTLKTNVTPTAILAVCCRHFVMRQVDALARISPPAPSAAHECEPQWRSALSRLTAIRDEGIPDTVCFGLIHRRHGYGAGGVELVARPTVEDAIGRAGEKEISDHRAFTLCRVRLQLAAWDESRSIGSSGR